MFVYWYKQYKWIIMQFLEHRGFFFFYEYKNFSYWYTGYNLYENQSFLQVAESGNLETFKRLYFEEPAKLIIRDSRGRTAVHQAAAKNRVNILEFILSQGGGNDLI